MKILLASLPPTDINSPSIALSILKKFMLSQGVNTEILYWNFDLSLMSEYADTDENEINILPFLSLINDQYDSELTNSRILSLLQKLEPEHLALDTNYYADFLEEKKKTTLEIIRTKLEEIDFSEVLLFGISAKNNQLLPAIILSQEIKNIAPQVKIIIGGFGGNKIANEAMQLCNCFDFVTWGEGEYPLLQLSIELINNTNDFATVPRLIFRTNGKIAQSQTNKSEYLDFKHYIYPDFDDFVKNHPDFDDNDKINFPINTIRSCNWSKCKFCDFNAGYRLRSRTPECIVNEIHHITEKYKVSTFSFADSDTFGNKEHFEELLDRIIALKNKTDEDYQFWSEIIPNNHFNASLFNKMAIAGFKNIFIGYDGLSDTMLTKMNKSNSFADNIFFVKQSILNGINPLVNVIKGIPDETEADIQECIKNLHYLRFFYSDNTISFFHTFVSLVLSSKTKYFASLLPSELEQYSSNNLTYLLPESFSNSDNRFHLFRFKKHVLTNQSEWDKLIEIEEHYKNNKYSYKIQEINHAVYYTEYCNGEEISQVIFEELEYIYILKATNSKVYSFSELYSQMIGEFTSLTEVRLKTILSNLQDGFLIYCNQDYSNIVSLIDVKS